MKKVHVIGATGRIGSYLCSLLLEEGYKVIGYSRGLQSSYKNLRKYKNYSFFIKEREDAIEHAINTGAEVICDLLAYNEEDAKYLYNKLLSSGKIGTIRLIIIGSIWVYGNVNGIVDELSLRNAKESYGKNKALMEAFFLDKFRTNHLKVTIIHPGHVCGKEWFPVNAQGNRNEAILNEFKRGNPIFLPNYGKTTLQHVHAIDVSRLILKTIENDISIGETFNIACKTPITLKEYAELIFQYYGNVPNIKYTDYSKFLSSMNFDDRSISREHIENSVIVFINKAKVMLDFEPTYSEKDIIMEYLSNLDKKKKLIDLALVNNNEWNAPAQYCEEDILITVIIPVYKPTYINEVVNHLVKIKEVGEIILVDDSGNFNKKDYEKIKIQNLDKIRIIYHKKNLGRPSARNSGAKFAKGELLLFLDQDMFLNPNFLTKFKEYYSTNKSLVFLGLRETVTYDKIPSFENWYSPDKSKDWRFNVEIKEYFDDLTVLGIGSKNNNCELGEQINIFKHFHSLKTMGISKGDTIGFWDLPSIVISHTMALTKKDFLKVGGFPEWIEGWGGEDIVFGFLSCAANIPIILSDCCSFQAYHAPYSGSEKNKLKELRRNLEYYKEWAKTIECFPKFNQRDIDQRCKIYKG